MSLQRQPFELFLAQTFLFPSLTNLTLSLTQSSLCGTSPNSHTKSIVHCLFVFLFTTSTTTFNSFTGTLPSLSFITCTFVSMFRAIALYFHLPLVRLAEASVNQICCRVRYHHYWLCLWYLNLVFASRQSLGVERKPV